LEEITLHTADGLTLSGFYLPSRNGAAVIMGHGLGENRMRFLPVAELLARHGYGALFFDWRAHGDSEGQTSTWSDREQYDFTAAVDFASRRPDIIGGRIAGLGFSIGASTVALVAARDPRVRAVILEAVFPSFEEEMQNKMGGRGALSLWPTLAAARFSGVNFTLFRPIQHIAVIAPRAFLFIGGDRDSDTPPPFFLRVFAAAGEPKELWIAEGAEHGEYRMVAPAEYERRLLGFLERAFPAAR
jgi:pimeloyl-ACP methyl ester carboxylesterase